MRSAARHELRLLAASRPALPALLWIGRFARPIRKVPKIGWLVADTNTARKVLADNAHFTVLDRGGVGRLWEQVLGEWVNDLFDGKGHRTLRVGARDLFDEKSAQALVERSLGARLKVLRDELSTGAEVDLAALGRSLVGRIVADLLRLDLDGQDDAAYFQIFRTGQELANIAVGAAGGTELTADSVNRAKDVIARLTTGVEAAWRTAPADTLLGRSRELGLDVRQAGGIATLITVAATETASSAMGRILALLHDTGDQHKLLANPDRIDDAIREGLRVTTPAPLIGRTVTKDVTLAGRQLRAGERVTLLTYTANNLPGGFDLDRTATPENQQLWFGAGRHHCLGAAIAMAEIRQMLATVTAAGRPWRITARSYSRRVLIPSYDRLTVSLT